MSDPTLIIAGNPGAIEFPIRQVFQKTGGYTYERRWIGPADAVRAILPFLTGATEKRFEQRDGSPIGILTASFIGDAFGDTDASATETLTISFKDEPFPINQNPTFIGITTAKISEMEKKIDSKDPNPEVVGSVEARYYDLRIRGVDNYRAKLPLVTWSRIVGENYPADLDLANIGAIYSTGDLADSIGAPILFTIPTGNVGVATSGIFTAGWLKDGSVDYTGDGKLQLILTAEYGLWANDLYVFIT